MLSFFVNGDSLLFLLLSLGLLSCGASEGLSSNKQKTNQPAASTSPEATTIQNAAPTNLQPGLENLLLNKLRAYQGQKLDVWALMSTGGWSDVGQRMVVHFPKSKKQILLSIAPSEKTIVKERPLTAKEWSDFSKNIPGPTVKMQDYAKEGFDALIYEFISLRIKPNGERMQLARVQISSIDLDTAPKPYQNLVDLFMKFKN